MKALAVALLLISAAGVAGHRYLNDRVSLLQTSSSSQSSALQTTEPRNLQGTLATLDRMRKHYDGPEFDDERHKGSLQQFQGDTKTYFELVKADASSALLTAEVGESTVEQLKGVEAMGLLHLQMRWGMEDADLTRIKAEMRAAMPQLMPDPDQAIYLLQNYKGFNKVKVPERAWAAVAGSLKRTVELFQHNTTMQDQLLDHLPRLRTLLATNATQSFMSAMVKIGKDHHMAGSLFPVFTEVGVQALNHVIPAGSVQSDPMPSFKAPSGTNPYASVESHHGRKWVLAKGSLCSYELSLGFKHDFFLADALSSPENTKLVARVGTVCSLQHSSAAIAELQFDIAPLDDTSSSILLSQPVVSIGSDLGPRIEEGGNSTADFTRAAAGAGLQNTPDRSDTASIFDSVDLPSTFDYSDYANFDSSKTQNMLAGWNLGSKYRESVDGAELMSAGNASRIALEVGGDWPLSGHAVRIRAFAAPTK
mmetsp:Transcript_14721/g.33308  ORF Transcript_14721/g.33308 Transcript_14721/m.33308 type:complete len:479 (-) Transcript_14721:76-1512(-)